MLLRRLSHQQHHHGVELIMVLPLGCCVRACVDDVCGEGCARRQQQHRSNTDHRQRERLMGEYERCVNMCVVVVDV